MAAAAERGGGAAPQRRAQKRKHADDSGAGGGAPSDPGAAARLLAVQASRIRNRDKRAQVWSKQKTTKRRLAREQRAQSQREAAALGANAPKKVQKTLDNTREKDETVVDPADEEVQADEAQDEFAKYFSGEAVPKIVITTCYKPSKVADSSTWAFVRDLLHVFPGSYYYERKAFELKKIVDFANEKGYTDVIVINENRRKLNGWLQMHLPEGPTAHFKLSSVVLSRDIEGHGRPDLGRPEVILNNFNTRVGHRVGRMLGALFHQEPNFKARRVATFHNQRDFLFFRHHRYIFDTSGEKTKARLQELGPRFTLKLRTLQSGTFDTKHGEYEWVHKTDMDTSRRRFFL